jgi:hypothetical protein
MNTENEKDKRTGDYTQANDRMTLMTEEEKVQKDLEGQGFTDLFRVEKGKLVSTKTQKKYKASDVKIVNFYRFEGNSNPDDMSVMYAIETSDGLKGTLTDAYGLYSDDDTGEFLKEVESHKKTTI